MKTKKMIAYLEGQLAHRKARAVKYVKGEVRCVIPLGDDERVYHIQRVKPNQSIDVIEAKLTNDSEFPMYALSCDGYDQVIMLCRDLSSAVVVIETDCDYALIQSGLVKNMKVRKITSSDFAEAHAKSAADNQRERNFNQEKEAALANLREELEAKRKPKLDPDF